MSTSVYTGLNLCVTVFNHSSTVLYRSLSAQRLSERIVQGVQLKSGPLRANKILPCQELYSEESVSYLSTYFTYTKLFNVIHFSIIVNLEPIQQKTPKM